MFFLTTKSAREIHSARVLYISAILCGLIPLFILFKIGFPKTSEGPVPWTPIDKMEWIQSFFLLWLIVCASLALIGFSVPSEHYEVMNAKPGRTIINPVCASMGGLGAFGIIYSIVVLLRYAFLWFFSLSIAMNMFTLRRCLALGVPAFFKALLVEAVVFGSIMGFGTALTGNPNRQSSHSTSQLGKLCVIIAIVFISVILIIYPFIYAVLTVIWGDATFWLTHR